MIRGQRPNFELAARGIGPAVLINNLIFHLLLYRALNLLDLHCATVDLRRLDEDGATFVHHLVRQGSTLLL